MNIQSRVMNLVEACENVTRLENDYWQDEFEKARKYLIQEVEELEAENARLREATRWIPAEEKPQKAGFVIAKWINPKQIWPLFFAQNKWFYDESCGAVSEPPDFYIPFPEVE